MRLRFAPFVVKTSQLSQALSDCLSYTLPSTVKLTKTDIRRRSSALLDDPECLIRAFFEPSLEKNTDRICHLHHRGVWRRFIFRRVAEGRQHAIA